MNRLLLAAIGLGSAGAMAITPVNGTTPTLTPVTLNNNAGDQTDPHVSGEWAAYTDTVAIRYYNFTSGSDAQIPMGSSARDLLSDISGSKVVFSRVITGVKTAVMVFDAATPGTEPVELDPAVATTRLGSSIGNNTVAYVDFGLEANGELVIHDLPTATSTRLTNDVAADQNPSVSPDGNVVTWEHCASLSNCDIYRAVKTSSGWSVGVLAESSSPEGNPDTNGGLVVYDSQRGSDSDLFWRPVAGGAELQLAMPGFQRNPSIAGTYVAFESQATLLDTTDIFVLDLTTNKLYQITNTPLVNEQLNDLTVLADAKVRVVWASDEDGFDQRNIKGATFALAAPSTCGNRTVVLDALRTYSPTHSYDAIATLTPPMQFAVPSEIPVTAGNSGDKVVVLSFSLAGGQVSQCRYVGGSHQAHPANAVEVAKASRYLFGSCFPNSYGQRTLTAGSVVTADRVTLHVQDGDSRKPTTEVRVSLAEICAPAAAARSGHKGEGADDGRAGRRHDELGGAPDQRQGPMGCSSAGGAPTVLMLFLVATWLLARRNAPRAAAVRARR